MSNIGDFDKELEKHEEKIDEKKYSGLTDQIETEYKLAYLFIKPRWDEWLIRLKLYSNQMRDKLSVGDPLLFTIFQTVLASLYDDKLQVKFEARERSDEEQAENLNLLAE